MAEDSPTTFPPEQEKVRLLAYDRYDKLYRGDHFDAFTIKAEDDFSKRYARLRYVVANFPGLIAKVMADMLFGETITIDVEENQEFVDALMEENQLITQLYESALSNSRRGDDVFKIRIGPRNSEDLSAPSTIILEQVPAWMYFPEFNNTNSRNTPARDCLIWTFKEGNLMYLHKEIHTPGYIRHEIYRYDPDQRKVISQEDPAKFGFDPIEETGVKRSLVFHIPNVRDGSGFWGASDYQDLESLFFALNNRITKVDNILDKHSDPILAVPPGVIDEKGKVRKEALGMFEVDNETPGFNKPEYIVWNANLESAFLEIDKLVEFLFMFSEVAPASIGVDKEGQVESGRALKLKMIASIRKRNRKMRFYDQAIKDLLQTAQELSIAQGLPVGGFTITKAERPKIAWGDGIINDETEMVDIAVKRIDAGLSSKADEIAKLDGITPEEAEEKVKEIDKEMAIAIPSIVPNGNGSFNTPNAPVPAGA